MRETFAKIMFGSLTPARIQSLVQRLMGGPRLETVRFRDGYRFDCYTSERYWWMRDSYEEEERLELEAYLKPDSILFDVGAHVGFWEVVLASRCRHVYAFEPSPQNFARLIRNLSQNHIQNVTAVPVAVSDQPAKVYFVENGSMSHLAEQGVEVDAIKLDEHAALYEPPTVVKIDIEGHAGAALLGMQHMLSHHRPALFLELHSTEEIWACRAAVDKLGYKFTPLGSTRRFPYRCRAIAD